jgi:hypothetical protein
MLKSIFTLLLLCMSSVALAQSGPGGGGSGDYIECETCDTSGAWARDQVIAHAHSEWLLGQPDGSVYVLNIFTGDHTRYDWTGYNYVDPWWGEASYTFSSFSFVYLGPDGCPKFFQACVRDWN